MYVGPPRSNNLFLLHFFNVGFHPLEAIQFRFPRCLWGWMAFLDYPARIPVREACIAGFHPWLGPYIWKAYTNIQQWKDHILSPRLESRLGVFKYTSAGKYGVNLVPRVFSSFKMAIGETPGQGCQNSSKNSLEFRHANTMKCLRFVWMTVSDCRKQIGSPDAGNNLRKRHFIMCHVIKYSIRGVFQQPWPGKTGGGEPEF